MSETPWRGSPLRKSLANSIPTCKDQMNDIDLVNAALHAIENYDDAREWDSFFFGWRELGKPIKPEHSGARMVAEILAEEVRRLRMESTA